MSSNLERYVDIFVNLNIDKSRKAWPESTRFQSPHKPLLLMSVIDMIAQGSLKENFVEPSFGFIEIFNEYWATVSSLLPDCQMATNFLALEEDGFWKPVPSGDEPGPVENIKDLQENYQGAKMTRRLFSLLIKESSRKKLRETLIQTHFSQELHPVLVNVALINHGAALYSKQLMSGDSAPKLKTGRGKEVNSRIGYLGFRKAILELYDNRCSICGIKLLSPEGKTVVEAVHIIPHNISKNDHPGNGIALCGTCRWAFENGFIGINSKYQVVVTTAVRLKGNLPAHLLILPDRSISKPKLKSLWPDKKNLKWHEDHLLRE